MAFFGGDPFFGDMHRQMRRQMRQMDDLMGSMMMDPFEGLMGRRHFGNPRDMMLQGAPRPPPVGPMDDAMMPFGGLLGRPGGLFGGVGMMRQMENMRGQAMSDPNAHVYTQSTVLSFGPEGPRESTHTVRKAGDVKEVRKTIRGDGKEKMSIGHHIGDRGHVIEKERGRAGQIHERQKFNNLRKEQAESFDREWAGATRQAGRGGRGGGHQAAAIQAGPSHSRTSHRGQEEPREPIVEEAEDSDSEDPRRHGLLGRVFRDRQEPRQSSPYARRHEKKKGPVIQEID